jgi:hypothetical protein
MSEWTNREAPLIDPFAELDKRWNRRSVPTMHENPYSSPCEPTDVASVRRSGALHFIAFSAACGLLGANVSVALWSALNFMTRNRHVYIVVATLAGGVIGALVARNLASRGRAIRIPLRWWLVLFAATLIWLTMFPPQFFGNRFEH